MGLSLLAVTAVTAVALVQGWLIPSAMAIFGTKVAGVGTMHAAGGVASKLQKCALYACSFLGPITVLC